MQSPCVKNGVTLGPVGTFQSFPKPYRMDVSYEGAVYVPNNSDTQNSDGFPDWWHTPGEYIDTILTMKISGSNVSEGGVNFFYPRIGLLERVRISGTLYLVPLGGFPSGAFCTILVVTTCFDALSSYFIM